MDTPIAFSAAKSRVRSSTDRYTIAPMMPAATAHSRSRIRPIVCFAWLHGALEVARDLAVAEHREAGGTRRPGARG